MSSFKSNLNELTNRKFTLKAKFMALLQNLAKGTTYFINKMATNSICKNIGVVNLYVRFHLQQLKYDVRLYYGHIFFH